MARRRRGTRRRFRRRSRRVGFKTKRYVKREISKNIETKYHYGISSPGQVPSTGINACFTSIASGVGNDGRIGNRIRVKWIRIIGLIDFRADVTNCIRMICYRDTNVTNGGISSTWVPAADLISDTSTGVGTCNSIINPWLTRVKVIKDRTYTAWYVPATGGSNGNFRRFSFRITPKKGRLASPTWVSDQNVVDDYAKNHYFLYFFSDSALLTHPAITYLQVTVAYKDA